MKKHIGTLLIILGIAVIIFPFAGRYIADRRQQAMIDQFYLEAESNLGASESYSDLSNVFDETNTQEGQEQLDAELEAAGISLSGEGIEESDGNEIENSMTLSDQPEAIGMIQIDKIDLRAPIAEGADLDTLRFYIGHMENTTGLGEIGNSVIAGHRSHSFGIYFNRLDEVTIGDEIVVNTGSKTIVYEVYETKIVEPNDVSVLKNSSSFRVLTLITCDPVYNPTHRLIVHAIEKTD